MNSKVDAFMGVCKFVELRAGISAHDIYTTAASVAGRHEPYTHLLHQKSALKKQRINAV